MVCGDGVEDLYEACDDGNDLPGDGCSADCRRWDRSGIAQDVPEVELVGWTPCWSSTYSENALVGGLLDSCTGPEMMLACRPVGAATFTVLAHAPQAEIIAPADPESADPWKVIHGSAWQWSTDQIAVFDPSKPSQSKCGGALCWPRIGDTLIPWGRCGDLEMGLESAPKWERVVLQSFY
jgi:cysteine-rich repeat protein